MREPIFHGRTLVGFIVCLLISAAVMTMRVSLPVPMAQLTAVFAAAMAGAAIGIVWKREVECALTFAIVVGFWVLLR